MVTMIQAILLSTVLLSASAFATPLGRSKAVIQQTDEVQCYSDSKCEGASTKMSMRDCCLMDTMLAYTTSDGCNQCVVYGWLKESVEMEERIEPYELQIGYLKGTGPNLDFRVTVEQCTTRHAVDYTVSPQQLTVIANTSPSKVEVDTYLDAVALEPDEHFKLKLELTSSPVPGFFLETINLTIIDTDELTISLTSGEYRVSEGKKAMAIGVKKNKQIASPLSLTITPGTVDLAERTWSNDVILPAIPADDYFSPNRATVIDDPLARTNKDFDDTPIQVEFLPDQYSPINDLVLDVSIIDDDLNEASEEYFLVRLDVTDSSNSLVKIDQPQVSLCKIVDNDPIRLGFTQPIFKIPRSHYLDAHALVASEDERVSQQTFTMIVQAVAASPSEDISVVSNDVVNTLFGGRRIVFPVFHSYEKSHEVYFEIHPQSIATYPSAFQLVISGMEHDPSFLHAKDLYQSTFIILE